MRKIKISSNLKNLVSQLINNIQKLLFKSRKCVRKPGSWEHFCSILDGKWKSLYKNTYTIPLRCHVYENTMHIRYTS